jgi:hypothetical protein
VGLAATATAVLVLLEVLLFLWACPAPLRTIRLLAVAAEVVVAAARVTLEPVVVARAGVMAAPGALETGRGAVAVAPEHLERTAVLAQLEKRLVAEAVAAVESCPALAALALLTSHRAVTRLVVVAGQAAVAATMERVVAETVEPAAVPVILAGTATLHPAAFLAVVVAVATARRAVEAVELAEVPVGGAFRSMETLQPSL